VGVQAVALGVELAEMVGLVAVDLAAVTGGAVAAAEQEGEVASKAQ